MFLSFIIFLVYLSPSKVKIIKNGIYNLMIDNLYLYSQQENISVSDKYKYPNTLVRIKLITQNLNNTFYIIEKLSEKFKLGYTNTKEISFNINNKISYLWNFIEINNDEYIIKNKNNCFIYLINNKLFCENIQIDKSTKFKIIRIFSEIKKNMNNYELELLKKEPIDILIKYIDLTDHQLERGKVHQIEKDYDNEELRYSIRSILKNIPWIRKIFILMPNEKVRYFNNYNLIKEKIVYIKDKDLLGYDSSNSNAFQFRYWKMKYYGISDNVIIMDDDYFIGKKLKKSDFFYVKNGKIVPLIITSNFIKIDKQIIDKNIKTYKNSMIFNKVEQNNDEFFYSKYLTLKFILNKFNIYYEEYIYLPNFTHNAIPINLHDVKEIFDIVYKSKYKYNTLDCPYRAPCYIQFQTMIISYTFIKYNRKVKNISYKYINLNNSINTNYTKKLFCINKGAENYSDVDLYKEKILMEYLFPIPSKYEIVENPILNISFNAIYSMEQSLKSKEIFFINLIKRKEFYIIKGNIILISILLIIKIKVKNY